jgi:hypothetical protein
MAIDTSLHPFIDHDQLAKGMSKAFFKELLELFAPDLAARLYLDDPALPVTFLDKEVYTDFPTGTRRTMDVLGRAFTRDGDVEQVLVLNENQETDDPPGGSPRDLRHLRSLIQRKERLPLSARVFLYSMYLQQRHFPEPVLALALWFCPGKGGISVESYDFRTFGAGLNIDYYQVCVPDLSAEEYLRTDNPVVYGLASRMKRGSLSKVELALECGRRIVRSGLSPMKKALLWNYSRTYGKLTAAEETEMQNLMDESEIKDIKDIKDSELTYFGRKYKEALEEGERKGELEGIEALCTVLDLRLTPARKKHLHALSLDGLQSLREHLVQHRSWPR